MIISPAVWQLHADNTILNYALQLFNGQPPQVFFPVFPWLVYPLCGLAIGYYLKQNEKETFVYLRDIGFILIAATFIYRCLFPTVQPENFYRTEWPETLYHIGIVLMTLYSWYWQRISA